MKLNPANTFVTQCLIKHVQLHRVWAQCFWECEVHMWLTGHGSFWVGVRCNAFGWWNFLAMYHYRLQQREGSDLHMPYFPSTWSMLCITYKVMNCLNVLWKELPFCSGERKMYNKMYKLIWLWNDYRCFDIVHFVNKVVGEWEVLTEWTFVCVLPRLQDVG